jgi:hypothetical protein
VKSVTLGDKVYFIPFHSTSVGNFERRVGIVVAIERNTVNLQVFRNAPGGTDWVQNVPARAREYEHTGYYWEAMEDQPA